MAGEMTFKEFQAAIHGFDTIKQEAMHYLLKCLDCFTVSAGPWTLTFDNSKGKRGEGMKDNSNIGAVCFDCARKAGFTPKDKAVGVWMDMCGICLSTKPCTDLWHDWLPPKNESEVNNGKA